MSIVSLVTVRFSAMSRKNVCDPKLDNFVEADRIGLEKFLNRIVPIPQF